MIQINYPEMLQSIKMSIFTAYHSALYSLSCSIACIAASFGLLTWYNRMLNDPYGRFDLAAICKIGDRLELQVRSLDMGRRIVPLALDAYDTDGLQGIYCPETSAGKNAKKASDDAISTAGQTFGGLVGDIASTVIRTGASIRRIPLLFHPNLLQIMQL